MTKTRLLVGVLFLLGAVAGSLSAQGRKQYAVTSDRAIVVTREVLTAQGFEVVRIETADHDQVVYYRRGNMGKGKGKGRLEKMVVRRVENRIVFVDTPDVFLVELDLRLRL
jgi:hypothetical protein